MEQEDVNIGGKNHVRSIGTVNQVKVAIEAVNVRQHIQWEDHFVIALPIAVEDPVAAGDASHLVEGYMEPQKKMPVSSHLHMYINHIFR